MAEKKLRIFNLAKDLGVTSQAIIEKCRAEGIDVKNHMHVVSAGLEATVREWFSEGSHATTVEEAKPVDLEKVRAKTRRKKAGAEEAPEGGGVATLEAPPAVEAKPPAVAKPAAKTPKAEPAEIVHEPEAPAAPAAPSEALPPETTAAPPEAPGTPKAAPEQPRVAASAAPPAAPAKPEKTEKPQKAAPPAVAGPQNIPQPAKLQGPRFVRMDKPETVDRPRPSFRPPPRPAAALPGVGRPGTEVDDEEDRKARSKHGKGKEAGRGGDTEGRANPRRGGLRDERVEVIEKLREWRDRDLIERADRLAHASGRGIGGLRAIEGKQTARRGDRKTSPAPAVKKDKVELTEPIIVKDFSREVGMPVSEIVKKLMQDHGMLATINTALSTEVAQLLALDYGVELSVVKAKSALEKLKEEFDAIPRNDIRTRPPVVTVLGHVDHGKTSLLDRIRKTDVAAGEAGGITQHIGAYRARVGDRWVTFLDTPGHAAFTAMRARGANLTDVVVLVVAADDGIMPTTVEAINHAKAAGTTIVVALNKIDLPHDINKIYGQLAEQGLTPSGDWGGQTDVIKVSALTGAGVDDLLAHLATLSEVLDLKADPTIPATGTVIEAERSDRLGNVAHILVQEGTIRTGDFVVCGPAYGRVRSMKDDHGRTLKEAGPATPVELTGLSDVPLAGDRFFVVDSLQRAKAISEDESARRRETQLIKTAKPTNLESLLASAEEGKVPTLPVIIKADVQGSVDVLRKALSEFPVDQVRLDVIHGGIGAPTESDLVLAQASRAIILSFYVVPEPEIARKADGIGVDIRTYRVIYDVLDDIKKALEGMLEPEEKVESRGRAEVRDVFNISKVGKIAGCFVRDGVIQRSNRVRVVRDGVVVKDLGAIESLRRFKDDVKEVKSGFECGIRIESFDDLKPGDVIEAFEVVKIARKLEGSPR